MEMEIDETLPDKYNKYKTKKINHKSKKSNNFETSNDEKK